MDFRGLVLRGSDASNFTEGKNQIVLQSYRKPEFSLQFGILKFLSVVRLIVGDPIFETGSLLSLKGNTLCD